MNTADPIRDPLVDDFRNFCLSNKLEVVLHDCSLIEV